MIKVTEQNIYKIFEAYVRYFKTTDVKTIEFKSYSERDTHNNNTKLTAFYFRYMCKTTKIFIDITIKTIITNNQVEQIYITKDDKIEDSIEMDNFKKNIKNVLLNIHKNKKTIIMLANKIQLLKSMVRITEIDYVKVMNNYFEIKYTHDCGSDIMKVELNSTEEHLLNILMDYVE